MTEEERKDLVYDLERTWDAIGDDILKSYERDYPDFPGLSADDVRSLVPDHLWVYGAKGASERFRGLSQEQKHEVLKEAFPSHLLYGR